MQLKPNDLPRHLAQGFACVYLVTGDEHLIVQECCDAIISAAQQAGYGEREVVDGDDGVSWSSVFADAATMSLFADKKVVDIRLPPKHLDREASKALIEYLAAPFDDTLILLRTARLEPAKRNSAWYKALLKQGAVVPVWPLNVREFSQWLDERCQQAGIELTRDAKAVLSERVEGNLLAAAQAVERLALAALPQPISIEALSDAVSDAAHFDTFAVIDTALAGEAARVVRMLRALREEGVAVQLLAATVSNQVRRMVNMSRGANERMPPQRARIVEGALRRLGDQGIARLLRDCARLDQQAKGMLRGDAWLSLETLLLVLAGVPHTRSLDEDAAYL